MKKMVWPILLAVAVFLPNFASAQSGGGLAGEIQSLQEVLKQLYKDMLPLCESLIGVGRGIAGFAATWFIGNRVWRHIAHAEPVDFYPLFRPFALALVILLWPWCLTIMNSVLEPVNVGTGNMVKASDKTIAELFKKKEQEMKKSDQWKALVGESQEGDRALWMKYAHPEAGKEGWVDKLGHNMEFLMAKMAYNFKNSVRYIISVILEVIYAAAALCINTLRTFNLIILAILGPLVLGISVFDGFQHTLNIYLARYINVFLWLPVANILNAVLGKIQENMLKMDLAQIANGGQTFFNSFDLGYIIFMVIGIVAYTTVPSICDQIVHVGGGGALQQKVTGMAMAAPGMAMSAPAMIATAGAAGVGAAGSMALDSFGNAGSAMRSGMSSSGGSDYFKDKLSG